MPGLVLHSELPLLLPSRRHPATMNIQRAIPRNHRLDEVPFEMERCLPLANHIAQRVGANLTLSGDIDQI